MSSVAFIVLDDDVIKYDWTLSSTKELQTDKPKRKHNTNNEHTHKARVKSDVMIKSIVNKR